MSSPLQVRVALFWAGSTLTTTALRPGARASLASLCPALEGHPKATCLLAVDDDRATLTTPVGSEIAAVSSGEDASFTLDNDLTLELQAHREDARPLRAAGPSRLRWFVAGSMALHAALAGVSMSVSLRAVGDDDERLSEARAYLMRADLRELALAQEEAASLDADPKAGGSGTLGEPPGNRFGVRGPKDNPDPHAARQAALMEAAEFGIIGLLSSGAGGDPSAPTAPWGRDDTSGSGAGLGAGHGRLGGLHRGSNASRARAAPWGPAPDAEREAGVQAGEWDDNANYREFLAYLGKHREPGHHVLDVSDRQFLVVRDAQGRGVPGCKLAVTSGNTRVALRSGTSGRAMLFPHVEGLGRSYHVEAQCGSQSARMDVAQLRPDAVVKLDLDGPREPATERGIDVAFVLDTTGSMAEEIEAVKATIQKVAATARERQVQIRVGLVEFRDRSDSFVTRVYPFTGDLAAFSVQIASMRAGGGGDEPEAVEAGVHAALDELAWGPQAARMAFVIGDARPHLGERLPQPDYALAAARASRLGIPLYTIAASGMDAAGQLAFRQMAQLTGATNLFVLRGGAGPSSVGGGDPAKSCGGTQKGYTTGNLDQLITQKIERELSALDGDPLRIAGLGKDERPTRCEPQGQGG